MSRVIKFRIRLQNRKDSSVITIYNDPFDAMCGIAFYPIDRSEWGILSIEQFTGLLDKNGKEIYEGDILRLSDTTYVVQWEPFHFRFSIAGSPDYFPDINQRLIMSSQVADTEKLGNIHENPELLESK